MARLSEGSGKAAASLSSAVSGIGQAVAKSAKKKKRTGSGVGSVGRSGSNAVRSIGRSVSNSSRGSRGNSSSGRSGSTGYNGGKNNGSGSPGYGASSGASSSGMVMPAAPKPVQMTPEQWLSKDTTYTGQQNSYNKALQDYLANYNAELQKYGNEYNAATSKVGQEREKGLTSMADDYASRGLLNSGVYGEAMQDYNTDMDTRLADMQRAKSAYEGDLLADKNSWSSNQQELLTKAKQEALNRRLAAYGI